jgi:hypothetical protein
LSVTRLALPNVVLLVDALALGLGLALADALGEALAVALALAEVLGDGLEVAAGTILAEVFAVLVALALGLAVADALALAVADALALADGLALALALAEALAEGLAAGVVALVAPYCWKSSTWRNMSRAVELTSWIVCCEPLPGTVTTSRLVPCGWTCAPELPVPLTRDWMTEMAAFISSADGAFPFWVWACRVTCVPLDRSRPRPTLN